MLIVCRARRLFFGPLADDPRDTALPSQNAAISTATKALPAHYGGGRQGDFASSGGFLLFRSPSLLVSHALLATTRA
jgi:hypothetical protein